MTQEQIEYGACTTCGYLSFPILALSPCGHEGEQARRPFEGDGEVYSWSRSWTGREESVLIAMADFLDGSIRVTAPMVDAEDISIGDRVDVVARGSDGAFGLRPAGA